MSTVLLNLTDISYTYFTHPILSGLNWEIQVGQKIGLIGANGGGKSTLLKLILGQLTPETGSIFRIKDLTIGYLPQDARTDTYDAGPARTVLEIALSGSPEIARLRGALAAAEAQMGDPVIYGAPARLARVMDEHARLLHEYEVAGGLTYENRVRSTLRDLGLGDETFDRTLDTLSGGQAKLVGLARLLVWQPDLLLLDEPDNHLDVAGQGSGGTAGARLRRCGGDRLPRPLPARPGGGSYRRARTRSDHGLARHLFDLRGQQAVGGAAPGAALQGAAEAHQPDRGGHRAVRAVGQRGGR